MIIRTANRTYLVVGYLEQGGQKDVCLCENTVNHGQCLIIRVKDKAFITTTVEFLYEQASNRAFTDFQECAVDGESLLLVFAYHEGQELEQKLSSEYVGLTERLAIIKNVLEQVILQNMPFYFASRCMSISGIYVKRSLDVSFGYGIEEIERAGACSMEDMQDGLRVLLSYTFKDELKKEVIKPMADFLETLGQAHYENVLELYRNFLLTRDQVLALSQKDMETPKTWIFRMWDRVKRLFRPMKRLFVILILLAGLGYMVWTIDNASKPASSARVIDQIGTLMIQ